MTPVSSSSSSAKITMTTIAHERAGRFAGSAAAEVENASAPDSRVSMFIFQRIISLFIIRKLLPLPMAPHRPIHRLKLFLWMMLIEPQMHPQPLKPRKK
jgi:hypothetical protein